MVHDPIDRRFPERSLIMPEALLERQARDRGSAPFAIFPGSDTWTYAQTYRKALQFAGVLRHLGVKPGDYVLVMLPNSQDGLQAMLGVWLAGAVYAPLNTAYRGGILEHTANVSGAEIMVAHRDTLDRLEGLNLKHLKTVLTCGLSCPATLGGGLTLIQAETIPAYSEPPPDPARRDPWDPCALIYTSGTTGPSKGVIQSWIYYHEFCRSMYAHIGPDDRYYGYLPLFHTGGVSMVYGLIQRGGSIVFTSSFNTKTYWDDVRAFGVTSACIMGSMGTVLEKEPASESDADNPMRVVMMGPMVDDIVSFKKRFGVELYTEYGTTEVGIPFRSGYDVGDPLTCGKLVDGYDVRLVDACDREVGDGEVGELAVRHNLPWALNSGYKDMPDKTAEAWRNGWFHTGDLFRKSSDGYYYFVDRTKDAIRRRGENVSSIEVEQEILAHPDVAAVAVIGIPSGQGAGEEEIQACIVPKPGKSIDPVELIEFLKPRMPHFMVPRFLECMPDLPMTSTSKIRKVELRAAGVTDRTFDREAAGLYVKRQHLEA